MIDIPSLIGNELTDEQLIPGIERMQEKLRSLSREDIIINSSAIYRNNKFVINAFNQEFEIDQDDFIVKNPEGNPESIMLQSVILSYLTTSDGTPPSNQLISFRELPDGNNYCHAFQGYAPDRLAKHFQQDIDKFSEACRKTGGIPVDIGDSGFDFYVFPRIKITVVYNLGDETFNSSASLLFDSNVSHYMVTAGLASIGAALVEIIISDRI